MIMNYLLLLPILAFTWLLYALITSAVVSIVYPRVQNKFQFMNPANRAWALRAVAVAPILVGGLFTLASIMPAFIDYAKGVADHCPFHDHTHHHLCPFHVAQYVTHEDLSAWVILASIILVVGWIIGRRSLVLIHSYRQVKQITNGGRKNQDLDVVEVASEIPLAFTTGIIRPTVVLASKLVKQLSSPSLQAVLAHERAHQKRKDPFWKALCLIGSAFLPSSVRNKLFAQHDLACEMACDCNAAQSVGDRHIVAKALLEVFRLSPDRQTVEPTSVSFSSSHTEQRLTSLIDGHSMDSSMIRWIFIVGVLLVGSTALYADSLHHIAETMFEFLPGNNDK